MGGIRNFPSAVITPITLPIADSTVICLVQPCFSLLPGLIGFVYADCSFADFLSVFFSCLSFPLVRGEALNHPPAPPLIASQGRHHWGAMSFGGARDAAAVPNYSVQRWPSSPPSATTFKNQGILPRSKAACQGEGSWSLLGAVALGCHLFRGGTSCLSREQSHTSTHVPAHEVSLPVKL